MDYRASASGMGPLAVASSPPRPPYAPVRGVPWREPPKEESIGDLIQEIRSIQGELTELADAEVLPRRTGEKSAVPICEDLFRRIGDLEERNALLRHHQDQLLERKSGVLAMSQDALIPAELPAPGASMMTGASGVPGMPQGPRARGVSAVTAMTGVTGATGGIGSSMVTWEEGRIRELELLLDKAERRASKMALAESVLEAQLSAHETKVAQVEAEAVRIKGARVQLQGAKEDNARLVSANARLQAQLEEAENTARNREEEHEKQLRQAREEIDTLTRQAAEGERKLRADFEQETTVLIGRVEALREATEEKEILRLEKEEWRRERLRETRLLEEREEEVKTLKSHVDTLHGLRRTSEAEKAELRAVEEASKQRLERELKDITDQRNTLQAQQAQLDAQKTENAALLEQLQQKDAHVAALEQQLDAKGALAERERDEVAPVSVESEGELRKMVEQAEGRMDFFIAREKQQQEVVNSLLADKKKLETYLEASRAGHAVTAPGRAVAAPTAGGVLSLDSVQDRLLEQDREYHRRLTNFKARSDKVLEEAATRNAVLASRQTARERELAERLLQLEEEKIELEDRRRLELFQDTERDELLRQRFLVDRLPDSEDDIQKVDEIPEVYRAAFDVIEKHGWGALGAKTDEWTPLHWAACENRKDICAWLVERGARPYQVDERGKSALAYAMEKGYADVVEALSGTASSFAV